MRRHTNFADTNNKTTPTVITKIAREILELATLESRNNDSLDFKEFAVWRIKAALMAAFNAGQASVGGATTNSNQGESK